MTTPDSSGCAITGDTAARTAAALLAAPLPSPSDTVVDARRAFRRAALTVLGGAPELHGHSTEYLVMRARIALGGEG